MAALVLLGATLFYVVNERVEGRAPTDARLFLYEVLGFLGLTAGVISFLYGPLPDMLLYNQINNVYGIPKDDSVEEARKLQVALEEMRAETEENERWKPCGYWLDEEGKDGFERRMMERGEAVEPV